MTRSQEEPMEKYKTLSVEKPPFEDRIDYDLFSARTFIFHGEVDEHTCKWAAKILEVMANEVKPPGARAAAGVITVILNSVGGDVFDGLLLFDTIRSIVARGVPVTIEVRGLAASMAPIILQAGSRRVASKYTRFMLHEIATMTVGRTTEQEEQVLELRKLNSMLRDILAERTGRDSVEIDKAWKKTDKWFSAEEALEFGLVDEVV